MREVSTPWPRRHGSCTSLPPDPPIDWCSPGPSGAAGTPCRLTPLLELFEFGPPPAVPPPVELRAHRAERVEAARRLAGALIEWRARAARRAAIEPDQLCTIDQLRAIASQRPRDADALVAATGFGRLTALALVDEIVAVLDDSDREAGSQAARSTTTGA